MSRDYDRYANAPEREREKRHDPEWETRKVIRNAVEMRRWGNSGLNVHLRMWNGTAISFTPIDEKYVSDLNRKAAELSRRRGLVDEA